MRAIRFHQFGDADQLALETVRDPTPPPGEACVRVEVAGVNYIDTYHREGLYPVDLPCIPGVEGAGTIVALGEGVAGFSPGDRVAWAGPMGAYAELVSLPAGQLVPVPEGVTAETAAAVMLQGMTAHYLSHDSFPLESGHTVLIHAGAGGVGLLLIQMAKQRGARVLTTVSTAEKETLAREAGADEVIRYTDCDFAEETMRLTDDKGVDVIYDSVGRSTFEAGLGILRPRGHMVLFGQSSGPVPPVDPGLLCTSGSLFLTRPTLAHYIPDRKALLARAGEVFGMLESDHLKLRIGGRYPLSQAAEAHRDLQGRRTTGKLLLTID
ncbi:MAG: quinone oxidoreductase [Verrucomicrobiota bacterium]